MPEDSINFPEDCSYIAYVDNGDGTTSMYARLFGGEPIQGVVTMRLEEMIAEWMPTLMENADMNKVEEFAKEVIPIPNDPFQAEEN